MSGSEPSGRSPAPAITLEEVLARLEQAGCNPKREGRGWKSLCPAHDDHRASLSINVGEKRPVVVNCLSHKCPWQEIYKALGLWRERGGDAASSPRRPRQQRETKPKAADTPTRDWSPEAARFQAALTTVDMPAYAASLGVSPAALEALGIGWATGIEVKAFNGGPPRDAWTFPMRDGAWKIIGINIRPAKRGPKDLKALSLRGSRPPGLFVPTTLATLPDPVWITEGPTSTAAALTAGYAAVGRPSCDQGAKFLAQLLAGRKVVLCGENDAVDPKSGRCPGKDGAIAVARQLGTAWGCRPPDMILPPSEFNDVRDWLRAIRQQSGEGA